MSRSIRAIRRDLRAIIMFKKPGPPSDAYTTAPLLIVHRLKPQAFARYFSENQIKFSVRVRWDLRLAECPVVPLFLGRRNPLRLTLLVGIFNDNAHAFLALTVRSGAENPYSRLLHLDDSVNALCHSYLKEVYGSRSQHRIAVECGYLKFGSASRRSPVALALSKRKRIFSLTRTRMGSPWPNILSLKVPYADRRLPDHRSAAPCERLWTAATGESPGRTRSHSYPAYSSALYTMEKTKLPTIHSLREVGASSNVSAIPPRTSGFRDESIPAVSRHRRSSV